MVCGLTIASVGFSFSDGDDIIDDDSCRGGVFCWWRFGGGIVEAAMAEFISSKKKRIM